MNFPEVAAKISRQEDFASALALKERKELLARAIQALPERERELMTLYYYEGLTMKEIADILDLTEGRISQIHAQALVHLRAVMRDSVHK